MSSSHQRAASCADAAHAASARALRALAVLTLSAGLAAGVASCTRHESADQSAAAVTRALGAVPIPTAPSVESTETAQPGRPAVLAIGGPVAATIGTTAVLATALGPEQVVIPTPAGTSANQPPLATRAVITLTFRATAGMLPVDDGQFTSRDQTGRSIRLTPQGTSRGTVSPTHPVTLKLAGTFTSGAAQITWSVGHGPLAIWTFNIELD